MIGCHISQLVSLILETSRRKKKEQNNQKPIAHNRMNQLSN